VTISYIPPPLSPVPRPSFAAAALALALLGPAAAAQPADAPIAEEADPAQQIKEIRVEGNRRVESEAIRRALKQKKGERFDPTRTADDIKSLWALNYFSDVQLLVQRTPDGIVYVVRVEERPAVHDVQIVGNEEVGKDEFKEVVDIKPFSILDMEAVRKNARKIQEKYVEKGYFLAEVTPRIEKVGDGREVDVIFDVREHSKVLVKEIRFIGAVRYPPEELKAVMATREGSYLSFLTGEGTYREELFQRDLIVLQAAYYDRGFINVKVEKPQVSLSPDKRFIYITLRVEEGDQYTIGALDFSGDLLHSKDRYRELMTASAGQLFSRQQLSTDILAITDLYYDEGYAYANVNPVTAVDAEKKTVDITFDIQKGRQVTIERIDVVGNTKTRDKVIRRELRVYEGDLFSGSNLRRSKERVTALGFFETVEVAHRPGSDDQKVVVTVEVKEKATGTFQLGFGFSNVENFIFTAQVSQNNFLGWGQTVSLSAQISGLRSLFQASFFDPYFLDSNFIFSMDLFRTETEYPDFIRQSIGGDANIGYHLFEDVMVNMAYAREHINVEAGRGTTVVRLANQFPSGVTSLLRFSGTWDRRDNRLFPSKGFMQYAAVEVAPSWLGGTFHFLRYSAYSRFYAPLPWLGLVFKTNATIGYIQQLGGQQLPPSELYYLGGINTVRGYFLRSICPTIMAPRLNDPSSSVGPVCRGGNKQLVLNVELEAPIFEKVGLRGVLFYDAGNAYAPDERFFQDRQDRLPLGLFHSVGFGFRWFSPIGPLRFEWGIPLNPRPGDQVPLFEFTIGNFF
jgi:outer membrane protein insertion porin family